jgi:hypothetical protein
MNNPSEIIISSTSPPILRPFILQNQRILSAQQIRNAEVSSSSNRRPPSTFGHLVRRNTSTTSQIPTTNQQSKNKNIAQRLGVNKNRVETKVKPSGIIRSFVAPTTFDKSSDSASDQALLGPTVFNRSLSQAPDSARNHAQAPDFWRNTKLVDKKVKRKKNNKIGIITKSTVKPGSSGKKANVSVLYNGSKFAVYGTYPNNFNNINNSTPNKPPIPLAPNGHLPPPPPKSISPGSYISGIGLVNFTGAACYSLAAIQLLFSIPEIRTSILKNNRNNNNSLILIKGIFTELNKYITTFDSLIPKDKGINFGVYLEPLIRSCNLNPHKQEDSGEFLLPIINSLDPLKDIFNVYYDSFIQCDDPNYRRPTNIQHKREDYQIINLNTMSDGTFSIQELIDNTNMINDGDFSDCGPKRFLLKENTLEKARINQKYIRTNVGNIVPENFNEKSSEFRTTSLGQGTKTEKYIIPDGNKYLLLKIVKDESVLNLNKKGQIQFNKNRQIIMKTISKKIKINVNPIINIEDNSYALYGAILYSGSGSSGHYIYIRVNNSKIRLNTRNINSIEQVFYNDSFVSKTSHMNLSDNGLVYLYKRLPNK